MSTTVFTDGACAGNPGPGGWAWAVAGGRWASGCEARSTNQRMEIAAALDALRSLDGDVEVVSDSTYVVNCFRDEWWKSWLTRGWINKAKKPVANRDLWEPLIALYQARGGPATITFRWVKGHSGDAMNDVVDRLAVEAAATQTPRSGDRTPTLAELGPADAPVRARASSAPASPAAGSPPLDATDPTPPEGRRLVITGHKPPELGGYGETLQGAEVRRRLTEIVAATRELHADLVVLTGLGLGTEQLAAEAAAEAGVPYWAVLAFPGQDEKWFGESRSHYRQLVSAAAGQILLRSAAPSTPVAMSKAFAHRDAWLAAAADQAVVVWNGTEPHVGRTVTALQGAIGEDDVWIIAP